MEEMILIVDDEPTVTEILARYLGQEGYVCETAGSGEEALSKVRERTFPLILTDIRMPGMDGIELLKEVKAFDSDVAVVMLTVIKDHDVAVAALRLGADDYILKPFDLEEVAISVQKALDKRRLILENREYQRGLERQVAERTREIGRLLEETRRRLRESEALFRVSQAFASVLDLDELLQVIIDSAVETIDPAEGGVIHILNAASGELQPKALSGKALGALRERKMRIGEGIAGYALEQGKAINVPDVNAEPRFLGLNGNRDLKSLLVVPLILSQRRIGILNVDSERLDAFNEDNERLLMTLGTQAAIAIENARLYEDEQERRHIAETLRQTSTVLSSTLELDEVLGLILQQLRQVVPYDSASIQRLQGGVLSPSTEFIPSEAEGLRTGLSKGERLEIVACQGFEEADKVVGLVFSLEPKFPNYRVVTTKAPLAIEDIIQDYPHFKEEADSYESGRIRSWLGVPLMAKDQVIGMIALDRAEVRPHTPEESQLAMAFANHAAIAIENARLYEEVRKELAERKKAEDRIKRAAEEWRTTFDSITDLVSVCDKDFRLTRVNKAYADVAKKKPKELIGKPCYEIVHGTNEPALNCPHKKTLETKKPATAEFFEPHLGMHLELSTSPIFDEKGEVVASAHLIRDITERKRAEEELRKYRDHLGELVEERTAELQHEITQRKRAEEEIRLLGERYQDLYNNAPIMYLSLDTNGLVIECNNTILDRLGYTKSEFIGKHMTKFVTKESAANSEKGFPRLLKTGRIEGVERQLVTKSGEIIDVVLDVAMEYDEHRKPIKTRATFADITERKRAEEVLRERDRQLENQERRRLAQEVHDGLIQEITSTTLQLELCEKLMAKNPERAMEQLEKAKNQARVSLQRARELVSDLRLAGPRKKGLVEALSEHIARLNEEGQTVPFTVTGTVKTLASTAETNLFRIAQEALTNARMHSQAEHVEVRLDYGEEMVTLVVMDDGVGFPVQQTLEKAQDEGRFGLMGMKERTYLLGGELDIESSPGSGTRLTVKVAL